MTRPLHLRIAVAALSLACVAMTTATAQPAPPADSLVVTLCGTSGPLPVKDRAKPCVAVQAGGSLYLIDVGPESTENLLTWRMPLAPAKGVFITHLHSDHIGGLGEFNMQSWVAGRPAPLPVYGPSGVDDLASGFNLAYDKDHQFRHAHHDHGDVRVPLAAGLLEGKVIQLPAPDAAGASTAIILRDGDLTVTAIAVQHDPVTPAFGYRFDYKGRSVSISGDTTKWLPFAAASKDVDVMLHEAQNSSMTQMMAAGLAGQGQKRMSSIMADTLSYHATPVEAAEVAKAANAGMLVLTHLTQAGLPFYTPETFTKGVDAVGLARWALATDGMVIELPVNGKDIRVSQK